MLAVADKTIENKTFATLFFDHSLPFKPGQFVMLWIPGVDEKPYTLSFSSPGRIGITIEAKGLFSTAAVSLEKGDRVGIRGPFGNGFTLPAPGRNVILVAGGAGMAPLAPLLDLLADMPVSPTAVIHGARTRDHLLFPDRFSTDRRFCTDDGSYGHKGFVTDLLTDELKKAAAIGADIHQVYACGPEIMMHRVYEICRTCGIPCQVSLERYMRCGFGVCGACVCGDQVVCTDGPVFNSDQLARMADFNCRALLKSGQAVPLADYSAWRQA